MATVDYPPPGYGPPPGYPPAGSYPSAGYPPPVAYAPPAAYPPPPSYPPPAWLPAPVWQPPVPPRRPLPRTLWLVLGAIGFGILITIAMLALDRGHRLQNDAALRYGIVLTVLLYVVVGAGEVSYLARTRTRLRWHTGNPTLSVLIGLGCGAGTAVVLLALVEAATGQVSGDSRVAFMVSDGSLSRILVAVLIGVVAAPLVEEILFRGLFAESLRSFGTPIAILASAVAFAAWHLNPAALRYYALLGALLGLLYWKRGLIASMTAHATFNGILTAVTIASVLAPGHTYTVDRLAVHAPSGWSTDNNGGFDLLLVGPADAQFGVDARTATLADSQDAQSVLTHLETVPTAQAALRLSSARFISLRPGTALEVDIADQPGAEAIYIPEHGMVYIVTYATAGNAQALDDVNRMLDSLTVG